MVTKNNQASATSAKLPPASASSQARAAVSLTKEAISRRAYAKFNERSPHDGNAETDWLSAEQELRAEASSQKTTETASSFPTLPLTNGYTSARG
jgi:Protein of unknown function (DUF2934)